METLFTDLVGCTKPIQLAGMGPICSDELCAAVSEAGGLGMITARLTPQPVATYTEPVPPGNARSTALPQLFIRCTANPPTTPDVFGSFAATARAKGWEVREIATGHLACSPRRASWRRCCTNLQGSTCREERHMERAGVDGIEIEYEMVGSGEPVVCIHGAFVADTFRLLLAEPSLASRHRLIAYHRRGYAGSTRTPGPTSLAQQAADCRALLRHLGIERAHVVGHSFGGCVALQLALDAPEVVHTLALLEPGLMVGASGASYREALLRGTARYREAGAAVVVDEFLRARWPGYRERLDRALPGAFDQAVVDAATWFETEVPATMGWSFGEAEARRIDQPVLSVLGGESDALWSRFGETHRLLLAWLPDADGFVLPGATHFLQVEYPGGMAAGLAAFFARHPLSGRDTKRGAS